VIKQCCFKYTAHYLHVIERCNTLLFMNGTNQRRRTNPSRTCLFAFHRPAKKHTQHICVPCWLFTLYGKNHMFQLSRTQLNEHFPKWKVKIAIHNPTLDYRKKICCKLNFQKISYRRVAGSFERNFPCHRPRRELQQCFFFQIVAEKLNFFYCLFPGEKFIVC
jgi:hypothetical protein